MKSPELMIVAAALTCLAWVGTAASATLDATEAETLLYMREEEKLARDVYRSLGTMWNEVIFSNIADSEQRHMDAVGAALARYQLTDPVVDDSVGAFTDAQLGFFYGRLVDIGEDSLLLALYVGAAIEEFDILDLLNAIGATDNADLDNLYARLLAGSMNHLRSFVSRIESLGIEYQALFLDPQLLDEILARND